MLTALRALASTLGGELLLTLFSLTLSGLGVGGSNKVQGNLIGTDKAGTGNLGNGDGGVVIILGANNSVGGNTIAFNGRDGVASFGDHTSTGDRIVSNSIFSNKGLGIDLIDLTDLTSPTEDATTDVRNANDPGDKDVGPNRLQNSPIISSAKTISGKTTIRGKLNSTPNKTYTLQFFSNPKGYEGKRFIGQKAVTTDGSGKVSFSFSPKKALAVGQTITATARKNSTLDTSEFSAARKVVAS